MGVLKIGRFWSVVLTLVVIYALVKWGIPAASRHKLGPRREGARNYAQGPLWVKRARMLPGHPRAHHGNTRKPVDGSPCQS